MARLCRMGELTPARVAVYGGRVGCSFMRVIDNAFYWEVRGFVWVDDLCLYSLAILKKLFLNDFFW